MSLLSNLFEPFSLGSLQLDNRFVMSPMTRYQSPGGIPTDTMAAYYARRAAADVGLVITEGVAIDRKSAVESPSVPVMHGGEALLGWKKVVDAVHRNGGRIAPQLWHVGNSFSVQPGWEPEVPFEGPSGLRGPGIPAGVAMTEEDIQDTIAAFGKAAAAAANVGFDAIAVHGAHGYLIDEFFWGDTNLRTDAWGGRNLAERTRFGVEVIREMRRSIPADMPILMRISQWKIVAYHLQMASTPTELEAWLGPLADAGVDLFDCSQRRFWEPEFEGDDRNLAGWVKAITGKPTMTVGSVGLQVDLMTSAAAETPENAVGLEHLPDLERRFARGDFDLVAVGRCLLGDPEWVRKIRQGREAELQPFRKELIASPAY